MVDFYGNRIETMILFKTKRHVRFEIELLFIFSLILLTPADNSISNNDDELIYNRIFLDTFQYFGLKLLGKFVLRCRSFLPFFVEFFMRRR